jgi:hypothetical protein
MEKRTGHRMDWRWHRPADFFGYRLYLQIPFPLMQEKGFHFLNLHSSFSNDATAEQSFRQA